MDNALPPVSQESWREGICPSCKKPAVSFHYCLGEFICKHCIRGTAEDFTAVIGTEYLTEKVPNARKGHLKDIEDRRWHPTEKRMFYHSKEKPKSYFFPKG